jgi:hypothetical protein
MNPIRQALLDTEDQICNLLEILDHDGNLEDFEQELDNISQTFDDWTDRLNEELKRREVREDINRKEVCDLIKKFETRMYKKGCSKSECWKLLRETLNKKIDEHIGKMVKKP